MKWLDGIWLWVLRKLGVHVSQASSVPVQDGPINHRRATYVSQVPDSRAGSSPPLSRGGANAPVLSAAASGRLRCQRCGGTRSRTYHWRHYHDPVAYPAIGVCSRRRTGCAHMKTQKEQSTVDKGTMGRSIAELPAEGNALDPK
ncbi:hypothetical protein AnigIFM59636_002466 [Aspergillus niger]|nr:hypothetical protein CBS147321_10894 [Aspergillus niger]GKZ98233.1 hypothetical protein AnigIFM59636_002466 [Aspergillus niger]